MKFKKTWGFLRETTESALKSGIDKDTKLPRTGLDEYLLTIFPNVNDWVHDEALKNHNSNKRPDYRSEKLKLIVEFDGIPHYTSPLIIKRDQENTEFYENLGYKVVRIPYFIQLTNDAVKKMFDVDVQEQLFDENIPSLGQNNIGNPSFLCHEGIKRMAKDFALFPKQYQINLNALKAANNDFLTGVSLLEEACNKLIKETK